MSTTANSEVRDRELSSIRAEPKNIEIAAVRTIEAYNTAYREKGIVVTDVRDYGQPGQNQGWRAVQKLMRFDYTVKPEKGIKKKIQTMVVQPVIDNDKRKYAIYYSGQYIGYDSYGNELSQSFSEGWYYRPTLRFVVIDLGNPFDPKTGERRGEWKAVGGPIYEHYIFLPENPKERRKFLEDLFKKTNSSIDNCIFNYRHGSEDNSHSKPHGPVTFNQFCDLTFQQMAELQDKGYYRDSSGSLKDRSGYTMKWAHDKLEAIK